MSVSWREPDLQRCPQFGRYREVNRTWRGHRQTDANDPKQPTTSKAPRYGSAADPSKLRVVLSSNGPLSYSAKHNSIRVDAVRVISPYQKALGLAKGLDVFSF